MLLLFEDSAIVFADICVCVLIEYIALQACNIDVYLCLIDLICYLQLLLSTAFTKRLPGLSNLPYTKRLEARDRQFRDTPAAL